MAKSVTTIPATLSRFTAAPINSTKKRRVAAYARVSTDNEEQLTSYEAQVDYYTNYIQGRDDWEFAGVYTDEGITGTNTKKREGFKSMVADALAGKIDLIITKSVSRFARNTVDSLTPHDRSFFLIDHHFPIHVFVAVGGRTYHIGAVLKTLLDAPFVVFRKGAGFVFRKARHDGKHQL